MLTILKAKRLNGTLIWLIFSIVVLTTISFLNINKPPHSDERHFVRTINLFYHNFSLSTLKDYPEITPPLFYYLFALWAKVFGFSLESLRIFNIIIALFSWQLIFHLYKFVTQNIKHAFLLSLLAIVNPYFIGVSFYVYNDNLALLFLLSSLLAFFKDNALLMSLFFSLSLLTRQYSIIFPLTINFFSLITFFFQNKENKKFIFTPLISFIPLFVLIIIWNGFAPKSGEEFWIVKNRAVYNIDYINAYISFSSIYAFPLAIYLLFLKGVNKISLLFAILTAFVLSHFPIKPSLAALAQTNVLTIGYAHKFLVMLFGYESLLLKIVLFLFLLLGSYVTISLGKNLFWEFKNRCLNKISVFPLLWFFFLLIMPFSFQVWEKYLVMILPFYIIAIYSHIKNDKLLSMA